MFIIIIIVFKWAKYRITTRIIDNALCHNSECTKETFTAAFLA